MQCVTLTSLVAPEVFDLELPASAACDIWYRNEGFVL
jgi:hypothetical protein